MAFVWGVQDSSISIHLDAILCCEFSSNKEPFSCDVLVEAIGAFTFDILASFMTTRVSKIVYLSFVGAIGISSAFSSYFFKYKPESIEEEGKSKLIYETSLNND